MRTLLDRRSFCGLVAAATLSSHRTLFASSPAESPTAADLVASVDRPRILRQAAKWLPEKPVTVTASRSPRSPGTLHDFFSEADYFWPDPAKPSGPYINRDGQSNPDNIQDHRRAMIRLSQAVPALTAAYVLTDKKPYAHAAIAHLRAWFVTPATRMTPNLEFSQGIRNTTTTGRSYGIIDTLHLVEVARSVPYLLPELDGLDYTHIQRWFSDYLEWMRTSDKGVKERDAINNHGICWALQASEFARLTGNVAERDKIGERFRNMQLPDQMAVDGSFPRELARTKPYGYSIFNFDVAAALCWSLGDDIAPENKPPEFSPWSMHRLVNGDPAAAEQEHGKLIRYARPDGKSMCRGAEFLYPFLADKTKWPYPHDVQHWESWPVRSPGLLFCGLACGKPEYIALWRKLDPDPKDPEIIRNFPIRQPLLWVS